MKKNKLQEIVEGHHKIEEEERLRFDQKPSEIPPLPKGKAALTPTTKAGWQTEGIIRAIISNLHNGKDWEKLFIHAVRGSLWENNNSSIRTSVCCDEFCYCTKLDAIISGNG